VVKLRLRNFHPHLLFLLAKGIFGVASSTILKIPKNDGPLRTSLGISHNPANWDTDCDVAVVGA
jgi:hypothetical protein